jgi:hypothetical protein
MSVNDIVEQVKALSQEERRELLDRLLALPEDEDWSEDELAEMLAVEPLTGKQIVEAGLTGGWRDLDIADGAAWVEAQRRKRQERRRW